MLVENGWLDADAGAEKFSKSPVRTKKEDLMDQHVYCQSCGMPITEAKLMGTKKDGGTTEEFCTYCYQKGKFTQDVTMEEMIETCVPHMVDSGMQETEARELLCTTLPNLARWKKV